MTYKHGLPPRQFEVVCLLAKGFERTEIADIVGISKRSVDSHRLRALKTLELRNNVELAHWAISKGIVEVEE